MKIYILSDIHGNLTAFETALNKIELNKEDKFIFLGDIIDYGPNSNEVINCIKRLEPYIMCNIMGNHEFAILSKDYFRFSTERGKNSANYTRNSLNENSWNYIQNSIINSGKYEFGLNGKKCLAVHGSLEDEYWKPIKPDDDLSLYSEYDYVFSGHSHLPHCFEKYYNIDCPRTRNRKKTMFINPGSVGQPRNLCPLLQYAIWDTETDEVTLKRIKYDIKREQLMFNERVDSFYRDRLEVGI